MKKVMTVLILSVFLCGSAYSDDLAVADNRIVSIDYTLYIDANKVVETTLGKQPLTYVQGKGQLLKTLEDGLRGMKKGQKKSIILKPEDAYGESKKDFFVKMPLEKLPEGSIKVGELLTVTGAEGKPVKCRVHKIKGDIATLDFNHPFAGKTLRYRVKVVDVKDVRF